MQRFTKFTVHYDTVVSRFGTTTTRKMPDNFSWFLQMFHLLKQMFYFEQCWSYSWPIFWGVFLAAKAALVWSIPADVAYCHVADEFFPVSLNRFVPFMGIFWPFYKANFSKSVHRLLTVLFSFNKTFYCYQAIWSPYCQNSSLQCRGNRSCI